MGVRRLFVDRVGCFYALWGVDFVQYRPST